MTPFENPISKFKKTLAVMSALVLVAACGDSEADKKDAEPPVRALKTFVIAEQQKEEIRRYPSVLQPSEITTLSFEISGRLEEVNLNVGQNVTSGQTLVELDMTSLQLAVDGAEASLEQAQASAENAKATQERLEILLKRGATTQVAVDDARTSARTATAQADRASKDLDTAKENLTKANLQAPYDGIINSVSAESFATVAAGTTIATMYSPQRFEVSFPVSYEISTRLAVGKKVTIRLADNPSVSLPGVVSELGSRADTVSSFPVIVRLVDSHPEIKAGMAVEVSFALPVTAGEGYLIPLSALIRDGQIENGSSSNPRTPANVYLFDEGSQTVKRHQVTIGGIRENEIIVVDGLKPGDLIASAGVSFLRDGQKVKLLKTAN